MPRLLEKAPSTSTSLLTARLESGFVSFSSPSSPSPLPFPPHPSSPSSAANSSTRSLHPADHCAAVGRAAALG